MTRLRVIDGGGEPDMTIPVLGPCACPHCDWDDDGHLRVTHVPALKSMPLVLHGHAHFRGDGRGAVVGLDECGGCGEPLSADNVKARTP